jgi:hypothetical protein
VPAFGVELPPLPATLPQPPQSSNTNMATLETCHTYLRLGVANLLRMAQATSARSHVSPIRKPAHGQGTIVPGGTNDWAVVVTVILNGA